MHWHYTHTQDDGGYTALHYAVQSRDARFIKAILGVPGVDIDIPDNDGQTPFVYFLRYHDEPTIVECVDAFMRVSGAVLNQRIASGKFKGDFPLNVSFQNTRSCGLLLETILKHGAIVDVANFSNDVPLMNAVTKRRLDWVLLLLKFGASVYLANNAGNTPLSQATKAEDRIATVMKLVEGIQNKMRSEFSLTLQYDIPRMIGIGLFTDVGYAQGMRNMIAMGVAPDVVKRFSAIVGKVAEEFNSSEDAFDLLYYNEDEGALDADESNIDTKLMEFIGESINNKHKFGMGLYGDYLKARYKGCTVGLEFIRHDDKEKMTALNEAIRTKMLGLDNDTVLKVIGTSLTDNALWVVTEYTDKGCLFDLLQGPKLSWGIVTTIALDIAEGLRFLREHDIVHGQLNSTRVLITLDGRAKIGEFGFREVLERKREKHLVNVEIGYMAPEHLADPPVFTPDGDKYSYGMICWEMVTRLIAGEHVIPYYSNEEDYSTETDTIIKKKIMTGNIPTLATREVAQVFTAPPRLGKLYKNICQTKPNLRWELDKIVEEWKAFDEENQNDPKKWKNCLQTDGELCPGEYANKKYKLVHASEDVLE